MEQPNTPTDASDHAVVTRRTCPECRGDNLEWGVSMRKTSGVADGRLRLHEVACDFFLGCCDCSETITVVDANQIATHLTDETYG